MLNFLLDVRCGVEIGRAPQLNKRKGSLLLTAFIPIRIVVYTEAILVFCATVRIKEK